MHQHDWVRDPPRYRWRIECADPTVHELVMVFHPTCVEVHLTRHDATLRDDESTRERLWYDQLRGPDVWSLRPLLQAIAQRGVRDLAEEHALDGVFWQLLVLDKPGWGLMAKHLPDLREWYDAQLAQGTAATGA
jgi:hypothetical protein